MTGGDAESGGPLWFPPAALPRAAVSPAIGFPSHAYGMTVTTIDRGWSNHVRVLGDLLLEQPTFAMTGQVRVITRLRLPADRGKVTTECLSTVR